MTDEPEKHPRRVLMPSPWRSVALAYFPLFGSSIVIVALVVIEIMAQTTHRWLGGIALPYISDTGAIPPGYHVFAIAGTTGTVLLVVQHAVLSPRVRIIFENAGTPASARVAWLFGCALAALGAIALVLLMVLSTYDFPSAHAYSAYVFFVMSAISMCDRFTFSKSDHCMPWPRYQCPSLLPSALSFLSRPYPTTYPAGPPRPPVL